MKRTLRIFSVLIFAALILYFFLDSKLYYYGRNSFDFYNSLPLKIKPQFWGYDKGNFGFVLVDEYEMTLIAHGDKYFTSDIEVGKIIRYGFKHDNLIALIVDLKGNKYFIECLKNNDKHSKMNFIINVWSEDRIINFDAYKWIEIENQDKKIEKMVLVRNYIFVILIVLIFIYFFKFIKLKRIQ